MTTALAISPPPPAALSGVRLALVPPPARVAGVAPTAARPRALDGIVGALCTELRTAAEAGDDVRARFALGCIITALGGTTDREMASHKADRAFDFRVVGNLIEYKIERHPGRSWLTHRTTLRYVSLVDGTEGTLYDACERLYAEQLLGLARQRGNRARPKASDFDRAAFAAVDYATDLAIDLGSLDDEDIAVGWIAVVVTDHTTPRDFLGKPGHIVEALRQHYGADLREVLADDFRERAENVVRIAQGLWSALHARVNGGGAS